VNRFAILTLAAVATGCVTVSSTVLRDRSAHPVPASEVDIFLEEDEIPESCERVAILHAEGLQDYTNRAQMFEKLREEAGKLGGNAIQLRSMEEAGTGERIADALLDREPERRGEALALWCPEG